MDDELKELQDQIDDLKGRLSVAEDKLSDVTEERDRYYSALESVNDEARRALR